MESPKMDSDFLSRDDIIELVRETLRDARFDNGELRYPKVHEAMVSIADQKTSGDTENENWVPWSELLYDDAE